MDKRKYKRSQYAHVVDVKTQIGLNLRLEILDCSIGGMSLVSHFAFDQGDILELDYLITQDGNKRGLKLMGEVIHSKNVYQEYTFGVRFL